MQKFLFACVHNAGRSQMAEAFFNRYADPTKARSISAGTQPVAHIHPQVLKVMNESGFDLSAKIPMLLNEKTLKDVSVLITMGCGEACPVVPGLKKIDWPFPDPKDQSIEAVREIQKMIQKKVLEFIYGENLQASDVEIKKIQASDVQTYKKLRLNSLSLAPESFCSKLTDAQKLSDEDWAARVQELSQGKRAINFIAWVKNQPVGMLSCYVNKNNQAEMAQMWVEPQFRKRNIGYALVFELKNWVRKNWNFHELQAEVLKTNLNALYLYELSDFKIISHDSRAYQILCKL